MAAARSVLLGVALTALCGVVAIGEIIFSRVLMSQGWPYFYLASANMFALLLLLVALSTYRRDKLHGARETMWMITRAFLSNATFITGVLAVNVGADPGDVASLTSINIVFAALLGHAFLGEKMRLIHLVALAASIGGALIVTRPQFLFGEPSSWGYVLAVGSGFLQACVFICARKSAEASGWLASAAEAAMGIFIFPMMPLMVPMQAQTLEPFAAKPGTAVGFLIVLFGLTGVGIVTGCVGSQLCPAAVSAMVMTASSMVTGYVAQAVLFSVAPRPLTLVGAALMLLAVVIMAVTRIEAPAEAADAEATSAAGGAERPATEEDATASLFSFVASEFAQIPAKSKSRLMRLRRPIGDAHPSPSVVGASEAVDDA